MHPIYVVTLTVSHTFLNDMNTAPSTFIDSTGQYITIQLSLMSMNCVYVRESICDICMFECMYVTEVFLGSPDSVLNPQPQSNSGMGDRRATKCAKCRTISSVSSVSF